MVCLVLLGELLNVDWLLKIVGVIVELIVNFVVLLLVLVVVQFEWIVVGFSGDLEVVCQVYEVLLEEVKNDLVVVGSLLLCFMELQMWVIVLLMWVGLLVDDIFKSVSNLVIQGGQGDGLNCFCVVFGILCLLEVVDSFCDDEVFVYWWVVGFNLLLICCVDVLLVNFLLGEEQFCWVMGVDDSLLEVVVSCCLYLLDYVELGKLVLLGVVDKLFIGMGFVYVLIVLFVFGKDWVRLLLVVIQCGQDFVIYLMFVCFVELESDLYWGWQMVKMVVQVVEENYYEMFVYLVQIYLVSEVFCLVIQCILVFSYLLYVLFVLYFEGILFINEGVVWILLFSVGFIDVMFVVLIQDIQVIVGGNWLGFDFYCGMLLESLKVWNVDDLLVLLDYFYCDDGLLVWNVICQWVVDYVVVYYVSDGDVIVDVELVVWVGEVIGSGKVVGFCLIIGCS